MALNYRIDSTTKSVLSYTSRVTTPSICYRQNGTTYYVPLLENGTSTTIDGYTYSVSGKTICCRYNNKTYKSATDRTVAYDIPAGTYTPSAFKDLIYNFLPYAGASRTVASAVTATVNGQSVTLSAGGTIYRSSVSSGSQTNYAQLIGFGTNGTGMGGSFHQQINFTDYHQYCVYSTKPSSAYATYENYSITVTGIKFN